MTNTVVYATDENYWMPLYVSLFSLLDNNPDLSFEIFIMSKKEDDDFDNFSDELQQGHAKELSINFVEIDESQFDDVPEPAWFSEGIYYRLLINSLLPVSDRNVLYLDCDTLVTGSIKNLFETDLSGSIVGATPETHSYKSFFIGLPVDAHFYNTGILYINMHQWEKSNIEIKALEYIKDNPDMNAPLQEILNTIIYNNSGWKPLHPKYNAMVGAWVDSNKSDRWGRDVDPKIVHYFGGSKPWQYRTECAYKDDWWDYVKQTPYQGHQPTDKTLKNQVVKSIDSKLEPYPTIYEIASCFYQLIK
jgi:lipopolysaccharide biosynthesis glycosyltransferase